MAYGWWARRRRRWRRWKRRPWRRRWRTRRRRPRRRYRRRRHVRRRRRGRWRRRYRKWRRKGRRRGKKKIIIRQWQPNYRRRCNIVGYMPVLICGNNTVSRNYATHSDDSYLPGPFGGGMTTDKFTLRILYDEYKRFMNYWTASNEDLDLCRYRGCTLWFFRHPEVDFIILINTMPPFLDTQLTGPSIHPGLMALNKRARWIPSLKSRPGRKHVVKIRVGAPRMFTDKWYPQSDLCDLPLLTIFASAADMQYPFGSPLTDTVVVGFQVLQSMYNDCLSILPENFNTTASTPTNTNGSAPYYTFADTWYRGTAYNQKITEIPFRAATLYQETTKKLLGTTFTGGSPYLEYHGGLYSSIWLSAGRSYFETKGTYTDITYNPFTDRGEGNMVWIDWVSKYDSVYSKTQSKCLIEGLPLWAAVYGYAEYCSKATGDTNIEQNCRVVIRSPFTNPQLLDHNNPLRGYVPYSINFGNGKMPGGSSQVPIRMRSKWYPTLFHQKEVLEAIAQGGPFAYHSDQMKVSLGMKYAFKWVWGGNPVSQQVVRNPCKDTGGSSGNRVPRSVQIVDPKYNTPELAIHAWDFRRGLFGPKAIKRMQTEPYPTELLSPGRKRYRRDTEALLPSQEEQQKENLFFLPVKQLRPIPPWEESDQTQSEEEGVQQETQTLSQQLQQQLKEQQLMGVQLRALYQQLQRVQQNTHIDPTFLPRGAGVTSLFQTA
uniref:Capsid protein n=1 Tax=Alphatorquevirus homin1 TaxID=3048413 RepID=A0AAU8H7S0_9VIRU